MVLILGGAYQGKLDFAKKEYNIPDEEVFTCGGTQIDFTKRCIYALEEFALACVREGKDPIEYLASHRQQWQESVFVCRDIFCGVVPMEAQDRAWRQTAGRMCQYLSREAKQVSRIFCGLEQKLK